jgi:hypothetical protein
MSYLEQQQPTLSDSSRTLTIQDIHSNGSSTSDGVMVGVLRLRGGHRTIGNHPQVAWDEDVVDNEGCGRKKSKSAFVAFYLICWDADRRGIPVQFVVSIKDQRGLMNPPTRILQAPSQTHLAIVIIVIIIIIIIIHNRYHITMREESGMLMKWRLQRRIRERKGQSDIE